MNPRLPATRRHAIIVIAFALLVWGGFFVRAMFPFGLTGNTILYDLIVGGIYAFGMICYLLWVAVSLTIFGWTPSPKRRHAIVMAAVGAGILAVFFLVDPSAVGRRCGASLGICLQPVRDLQQSPAIAEIAAAGQQANLPQSDWPASLSEWKTDIYKIEVVPNPGHPPQISVYVGSGRLPRQSIVIIHPSHKPESSADLSIGPWTDDVWLGRRMDN